MIESQVKGLGHRKWKATEESFARFLLWLDNGRRSEGQEYLLLRKRLVSYFERKGCDDPDDLADDTLERVNRRLDEEGNIEAETPAKYCYITAKFVFLEYLRSGRRREQHLDPTEVERIGWNGTTADEEERKETLSRCLDRCLAELHDDERRLIVGYYFGERRSKIEHRRAVAESMGISSNALAIRACRIRERLEACIGSCSGGAK